MSTRNPQRQRSAQIRHSRQAAPAGFTLVELMIVVAIVGILAALATYGVRRYIMSTRTSEVGAVINAIRGAQEIYKQDTFVYLDVSAGSFDNLHPSSEPGAFKRNWAGDGDSPQTSANFRELGVMMDAPVYYTYAVVAGRTGDAIPSPPTDDQGYNFPEAATGPFYVVYAKGDLDGDGNFSHGVATSMSNQVYIENEGE